MKYKLQYQLTRASVFLQSLTKWVITNPNQILICHVHEAGRLANHGSSFSWTNSGLSSWGQCPTPSKTKRFMFGSLAGKELKYFPTGPSIGVNGS